MLSITTFGEVFCDSTAGTAVVLNDSGDFTVSLNPVSQLFEIHLQKDISRSIVFATARDPYLNDNPYITVAVQRKALDLLWIATLSQDPALFLRPRLIHHFGFWFGISEPGRNRG